MSVSFDKNKRRKKGIAIFSIVTFSLLALIGFLIFSTLDQQNKQKSFERFDQKITALTYKEVFLAKGVTPTQLSELSSDLSNNEKKMAKDKFLKLSNKMKIISRNFDKLKEVNGLFSTPAVAQDTVSSSAPIRDDLTEDDLKNVDLTDLSNNQFTANLSTAVHSAALQLEQIEKVKTEIQNNTASTTVLADIGKIQNEKLQSSYFTQLSTRDAQAVKAKYAGKKIIALSFDDGPNPATTPQLLDILKKNGVKATFCELGVNVQANPDIVKRVAAEGHEIISHSWSHPDLTKMSKGDALRQVEDTAALITQFTGQNSPLYRPPYGSTNEAILKEIDRAAFNWDVDTEDWKDSTPEPVVKAAVTAAHPQAVILMHDIHPWSVAAVPEIIKQLKEQGYTFVSASELIQVKYGSIAPHQVYY
ncbi:MAG: polysaccharide deacetylase family protein [Streptococcaceae bacterium]|jgi:peptidoglycan/xylan/chitin deacetylase (PgdA/CDA1 family)|nr:polysaccharide deacetylase family protein [Streptococcaceae bacterium]